MTRSKKTRKVKLDSRAPKPKLDKASLALLDKKPKKKTGKTAGNKQQEATKPNSTKTASKTAKDPRLGSKKPIDLGKPLPPKQKPVTKSKTAGIAQVKLLDRTPSQSDRLAEIEQDPALLAIISKQEMGEALSEQEVNFFNELMEEHNQISEDLGIEEDIEDSPEVELSEDELWNKLDSTDFSDFDHDKDK